MKRLVKEIKPLIKLYRDDKTGIAWIEDNTKGQIRSYHYNITSSGSVRGMKKLGYWNKKDKTVRCNGFIYNISSFAIDKNNPLDRIVANECDCERCFERRNNFKCLNI